MRRIGFAAAVLWCVLAAAAAEAQTAADQFQSAPVTAPPKPAPAPALAPRPRRPAQPEYAPSYNAPQYPPSYAPSYAPPATPATVGYDGHYAGSVRLQAGQSEVNKVGSAGPGEILAYENCESAAIPQSIDIRGNQLSYLFNRTNNTVINARVGPDGAVDGLGSSSFGGARLIARIQGGELVGTAASAGCKFDIRLRRQ
jgi:hypothetical protein